MSTEKNFLNKGNPLNPAEKKAFLEYEEILKNWQQAPFEAGRALQLIRDNRLYRELYPTFAAYTDDKWECSRSTADRLISAWTAYQLLAPAGVKLENEFQARALIGLTKEQIMAAGKLALKIADGKKFSARHFETAVEQGAHNPATDCEPVALAGKTLEAKDPSRPTPTQLKPAKSQANSSYQEPSNSRNQPSRPVAILFGDYCAPIVRWYEAPLVIANWLLEHGKLLSDIPFVKPAASAFPASARLKNLKDGSYIELGDDRPKLLRKARRLLDGCGHRDTSVVVKLSNGQTVAVK